MKKLQKNYTTPEQSKRLLELGLPADSADLGIVEDIMHGDVEILRVPYSQWCKGYENISTPCWSVGRLIEISLICGIGDKVPNELYINKYSLVDSLVGNIISRLERVADLSINDIDFSKLEE